jgi:hypothetical protein
VGNRVVKNPRSDSSKSGFSSFYSTVNTSTKKTSQHKTPCCLPVFWYGPSKSKLWGKRKSFLVTEGSTLELNISESIQIFFLVSSSMMYMKTLSDSNLYN